jgi:uncharacterized protein (DUF433 family)
MSAEHLNQHIEITPGIAFGKPHIAGHRITVEDVVIWSEQMGKSVDEIVAEYDLTLADIHAAMAYYFNHREEIDKSIREGAEFVATMRRQTPSILQAKLKEKPAHGGAD